jgi:phenylpyruvate tautomerase PptA (4-oxalocrotonate tautomerase family)
MPIVTVQLMEGVLSPDQKKTLISNIVDAVADVYGRPMRLFMNVVLEEPHVTTLPPAGVPSPGCVGRYFPFTASALEV